MKGEPASNGRGQQAPGVARSSARGATRAPRAPRQRVRRILVGSVGPPIPRSVIDLAVRVAGDRPDRPTRFIVFSTARIWGTRLGLPNPGLYPSKRELQEQQDIVDAAADVLRRRGFEVRTKIGSARNAGKAIAWEAERQACQAIVVGDPSNETNRFIRLLKGDEAKEVSRHTRIPVHTVPFVAPDPRTRNRSRATSREQ